MHNTPVSRLININVVFNDGNNFTEELVFSPRPAAWREKEKGGWTKICWQRGLSMLAVPTMSQSCIASPCSFCDLLHLTTTFARCAAPITKCYFSTLLSDPRTFVTLDYCCNAIPQQNAAINFTNYFCDNKGRSQLSFQELFISPRRFHA